MATITYKKLPNSEVEFTGRVTPEELAPYRESAVKKLGADVELKGFRRGHVPESVLVKTFGEMKLWEEMFMDALSNLYPKWLFEQKVNAIGRPNISITKIAPSAPVEFTITTAIVPEVTLGDYKKIRTEEEKTPLATEPVTNQDVDEVFAKVKADEEKAGRTIDDAEKLKTHIRESLVREKEIAAHQKKRGRVIEKLLKDTHVELPGLLVEEELARMEQRVKHDLSRMGVALDKYLGEVKKTLAEMRTEWRPQAEKNVTAQLALAKIGELEKITPQKELVDREVAALVAQHKVSDENARAYVMEVLGNELVLAYLEGK